MTAKPLHSGISAIYEVGGERRSVPMSRTAEGYEAEIPAGARFVCLSTTVVSPPGGAVMTLGHPPANATTQGTYDEMAAKRAFYERQIRHAPERD
jgi:hypothetical protein